MTNWDELTACKSREEVESCLYRYGMAVLTHKASCPAEWLDAESITDAQATSEGFLYAMRLLFEKHEKEGDANDER